MNRSQQIMTAALNRAIARGCPVIVEKPLPYSIVEKRNHLARHGVFHTYEQAQLHLTVAIPEYVKLNYFDDKTLTADDFCILPEMT